MARFSSKPDTQINEYFPVSDSAGRRAIEDLLRDTRKIISMQQELGLREYPRTDELAGFLNAHQPTPTVTPPAGQGPAADDRAAPKQPAAISPTPSPSALAELGAELQNCRRCPRHASRTSTVFGQGNSGVRLMIIGDGPSREDDAAAVPFSGAAGELLDKMLSAIGLSRSQVYLTLLTKCFAESAPDAEAIEACYPFLLRQIEAIAPAIICTMGPLVSQKLLHSPKPLSHLRGRFHDFKGIALMPTFHPDFLIKNQEMKKAAWLDLQMIQKKWREGP